MLHCVVMGQKILTKTAFENIVGKGKIAGNQQFLLFPQCFPLSQRQAQSFSANFDLPCVQNCVIHYRVKKIT